MKKKLVVALAAMLSVCCLGGCGSKNAQQPVSDETTVQETMVVAETTQSENKEQVMNDKVILAASFGTSYNDNRDLTIGAIETAIADAFPEYEVRRAFTSQIIIDVLKERDNLAIDNVEEALEKAAADGVKELIVQPTHLMNGYEYNDLAEILTEYKDKFEVVKLAEPLLISDSDFDAVVKAITEKTTSYDDGKTAICFMGHGTEAASNAVYAKLQTKLTEGGFENYYIGTVESVPSLEDVIAAVKAKDSYTKVILEPLMIVAGDHANNDMAGDEDSWKAAFENEGYEVECVLEGLGQIPVIQEVFVNHTQAAIASETNFAGVTKANTSMPTGNVKDGTYPVDVESSSSMFKIEKAELTVLEGNMTANITLSGTGYSKLYMGTAENAAKAAETDCIEFVEDANGAYTYTIPVAALDEAIDCAAFSKKKEEWYDRQLTFVSSSLPKEAFETVDSQKTASFEDGTYTIEVTLEGGSGKTTIISPATITITDSVAVATIQWSSPNYDYMIVDGEKYLQTNTEGDSVFKIPVTVFDEAMPVIANTVAMSKPHEIEYTLTFISATMKAAE